MVEFAPTLIPPELWLTLGSAETHEAGQTMLPATQKSWAARQPPLSPHSRFIPKASASLMRATCSTVTSRSYVNKWAWICFTFPPCLSITGLTYRNSHTPDIEVHTSSRTSKAHALFPQTAIGVIQTQLSKLHHFQCSRGETGGVSRKGEHAHHAHISPALCHGQHLKWLPRTSLQAWDPPCQGLSPHQPVTISGPGSLTFVAVHCWIHIHLLNCRL